MRKIGKAQPRHARRTKVRIDAAKKLLTESEISVKDIAEKVGYSNARSFMRSFMRIVGCSPSTWRASKRGM